MSYCAHRRASERGVALVLALLVVVILTLLGLGLLYITNIEALTAAAEARVNKALYAADAGVYWTAERMVSPDFFATASFQVAPNTTQFSMPDNTPGENPANPNITVTISRPSPISRIDCFGCPQNKGRKQFIYLFQIQSASSNTVLQAAKTIVADVEVGPLVDPPPKSGF